VEIGTWTIVLRVVLAAVLGGAIGFDRDLLKKPAGARTLMMVSIGACTFTLLGILSAERLAARVDNFPVALDPSRVLAGIAGGVGFLGAGMIIQGRGRVRGLTSAAGIWVTAAVGAACGLGEYALAIVTGVVAIITFTSSRLFHPDFENGETPKRRSTDE